MNVLETERLVLRRFCVDDAPFILRLLNEPSFLRFVGDKHVRTLDEAREYIEKVPIDSYERNGFGLYLTARKEDGTPVGICGLVKRDALDDVDIGFALLPEFWSKGYAVEVAAAVLAYGLNALGLPRIVAVANSDNAGSITVLEKLGLRFTRMARLSADGPELKLFSSADVPAAAPALSLVIPCFNEAAFLPRLLESVDAARRAFRAGAASVEAIVADNGSTDATVAIAAARGCRLASTATRRIGAVRNAGAAIARGEIIAFIDGDSSIHPETFTVIAEFLSRPDVVGGTTGVTMERWSVGIGLTYLAMLPLVWITTMDTGVVFCRRADFQAVGGYDETMKFAEDVKFLVALRRLGRTRGSRLVRARAVKAVASTRKFDQFGDWHYVTISWRAPWYLISQRARDAFSDEYWYRSGR